MSKVAAILRAHELARKAKATRKPTRAPRSGEGMPVENTAADYAAFQELFEIDDTHVIPDKLGKTGEYEPKSIYSPAPPSRIRFERPKKRMPRDPNAAGTDCELPADLRRHRSFVMEDGSGRAMGTVSLDPFKRRLSVSSPAYRNGMNVAQKKAAK